MNVFSSLLTCTAVLSAAVLGQMGKWDGEFDYSTYLEENELFRLYWTNLDDGQIDIGIEAMATGYIALGFSPDGGMLNSDIMLGWVDDQGEVILEDRHTGDSTSEGAILDEQQDLTLVSGEQEDGITRIRFTRAKSNACDPTDDFAVIAGTSRVIYAWSDDDPVDGVPAYHNSNRGSQSVNLDAGQTTVVELEDDVEYFDLLMEDWAVSSEDTEYVCKAFELPDVDSTQHIVKIEPIVQAGNEGTVHHVLMYVCPEFLVANGSDFSNSQLECEEYEEDEGLNMPTPDCRGARLQFAWAIGGTATYFPEEAGLPFGGDSGFKYAFFEVHYDNPELRDDIVDSSGLRLYYTPTLRENDIGVLWFGQQANPLGIYLPPGIDTVNTGYCNSNCTQGFFPEEGVTLFGSVLHAHTVGASINFRHIRNGVELEPVELNENYDFNFQQMTILEEPRTLLPGDEFMVECGYDTTNRDEMTYGGEGSLNEMCITFAFVYPAPQMYKCVNRPSDAARGAWAQELYDAGYFTLADGDETIQYITDNIDSSITTFGAIPSAWWEAVPVGWEDQGDAQAMYDKLWTEEAYAERTQQCVINDYLEGVVEYDYYIGDIEAYEAEEDVCDDTDETGAPTMEPTAPIPSLAPTDEPENSSDAVRLCMSVVSIALLVLAIFA